ncbi:MAG: signal peptidase [Firmicutes bacterium]|nr:signal peptidase [Bacillota bacterium]
MLRNRKGAVFLSETPETSQYSKAARNLSGDLYSWLQALVFALLLLILTFTFFGRIISVDGYSMTPTLQNRDMLLLQCVGYEPKQGDIVVLTKEFASVTSPIVKRIIATGGQTVEIRYDENKVYVDGVPLDEPYIKEPMQGPNSSMEDTIYCQVPEGSVFVMGDNRNGSSDSRHRELGAVDQRYILGRAFFVLLPFGHAGPVTHTS